MDRVDRALTGRLSDAEAVELESHLGECAACAREIEQARLVRQLLRASCAGRASEELRERVRGSARTLTYREVRVSYGPDGTVRMYDPATNTFAAYTPDGITKTFFRPGSGAAYWDRQPGVPR